MSCVLWALACAFTVGLSTSAGWGFAVFFGLMAVKDEMYGEKR